MKKIAIGCALFVLGLFFVRNSLSLAQGRKVSDPTLKLALQFFKPLPSSVSNPQNPLNDAKVRLGKMLYHDPRLSKSGAISCNFCHNLATYGVDNRPTSLGHNWVEGPRNAPTTLNAGLHIAQFWDGRAKDLEEQAKGPILNPKEMAMPSETFTVERIASIPEYVALFRKAFPGEVRPVTYNNIAKSIAAFERTLVTPSRFDRFLKGDTNALSRQEKVGLKTFIEVGCVACHNGPALGGRMYQKFGPFKPYWELTGSKNRDLGRYEVTHKEQDRYVFKVPSLRNIAHTYPYFHDGSVWNLEEAVHIIAEACLGKKLSQREVKSIVSFLNSLTGQVPKSALELPVLPPSTRRTPKPEAS